MSALPLKADIGTQSRNVRFVPLADIAGASDFVHHRRMVGRRGLTMTVGTNFGWSFQYPCRNCDAAVFPPGSTMTRVPTRTRL
jgi:hypothetical protein